MWISLYSTTKRFAVQQYHEYWFTCQEMNACYQHWIVYDCSGTCYIFSSHIYSCHEFIDQPIVVKSSHFVSMLRQYVETHIHAYGMWELERYPISNTILYDKCYLRNIRRFYAHIKYWKTLKKNTEKNTDITPNADVFSIIQQPFTSFTPFI